MSVVFEWLSGMESTKPLALVIFFVVVLLVVLLVQTGKRRKRRFGGYRYVPLLEANQQRPGKR